MMKTVFASERQNTILKTLQAQKKQRTSSAIVDVATCYRSLKEHCLAQFTDSRNACIDYSRMLAGCTSFEEALQYCKDKITQRLSIGCLTAFYIGITSDPEWRWESPDIGHRLKHRWGHMQVLLKTSMEITRSVEQSLVRHFHQLPGGDARITNMLNTPPGALCENKCSEHFLYVIWD